MHEFNLENLDRPSYLKDAALNDFDKYETVRDTLQQNPVPEPTPPKSEESVPPLVDFSSPEFEKAISISLL